MSVACQIFTRRRGRPRLHGTNAEKQRAYRNRHRNRHRDWTQIHLVNWILKTSRSVKPNAEYRRSLSDDLMALPLKQLQISVDVIKEHHDLRGRFHNERSGEGRRMNGMSEIERLIARREEQASWRFTFVDIAS